MKSVGRILGDNLYLGDRG